VAATSFQTSLRTVNDQRRALFGRPGRLIVFVCECRRRDCIKGVMLSADEYDALRPAPILAEGHSPAERG
jgi:hypothetical protein